MTSFNKQMTIEEATSLYKSKGGMNFFPTKHNIDIMKLVIDNHLKTLRDGK